MNTDSRRLGSGKAATFIVILVAGMLVAGLLASGGWNLVIVTVLMFVVMVVLGLSITGRPLGILINERRLMSLSRFQTALWTLIILSGYLTIALVRIRAGGIDDPLAISLDWRLWGLIGISTSSLVGTPLIYSATKMRKEPVEEAVAETARMFGETPDEVKKNKEGTLYGNEDIVDARFTDMFEGDEVKNAAYVDMAKVQMFFFTLIAAVSYVVLLFNAVRSTAPSGLSLPVLPDGLVAILGISHAGYLTNKAVDHTKTQ